MAVELRMRVTRDNDNRLSGTVGLAQSADRHGFSGTLELMRLFEELVPNDPRDEPPGMRGAV